MWLFIQLLTAILLIMYHADKIYIYIHKKFNKDMKKDKLIDVADEL